MDVMFYVVKISMRYQAVFDDEIVELLIAKREFIDKHDNVGRNEQIVYERESARWIFVFERNHWAASILYNLFKTVAGWRISISRFSFLTPDSI